MKRFGVWMWKPDHIERKTYDYNYVGISWWNWKGKSKKGKFWSCQSNEWAKCEPSLPLPFTAFFNIIVWKNMTLLWLNIGTERN